jgi:hypothetical protein
VDIRLQQIPTSDRDSTTSGHDFTLSDTRAEALLRERGYKTFPAWELPDVFGFNFTTSIPADVRAIPPYCVTLA